MKERIEFKDSNGKQRREGIYEDNSFVSQSSKFILLNNNIASVEIINKNGEKELLINKGPGK